MAHKGKIINFYFKTKGGLLNLKGQSMEPALKDGWKVRILPVDIGSIKTGDIVVFGKNGLTCHRIVACLKFFGRSYFFQKGDNSPAGSILEEDDLIGKVSEVFDEEGRSINVPECLKGDSSNINVLSCFYFVLYLLNHYIWRDKKNRFTLFVHRFCWKVIYRKT
ncbi:MAG: S26 family signal peptidase [Candidatus Omnitrophica bacterium]|nr:S26 family signal peptidase [Candidatus Omnitrophota bacterium]MDD5661487.1 S26 family signal peptidase [Candidatus Omnitrophota bacterium]